MANNVKYIIGILIAALFMPGLEVCWASQDNAAHNLAYGEIEDVPGGRSRASASLYSTTLSQDSSNENEKVHSKQWRKEIGKLLTDCPADLSEEERKATDNLINALQLPSEPNKEKPKISVLVFAVPRSCTTGMGAFIGSDENIYNLHEYTGFYLSLKLGPEYQSKVEAPYKAHYYPALLEHAKDFCIKQAKAHNCIAYVDSNPFNLLIIKKLQQELNPAIFIIMLRNYRGVISSLEQSYKDGREWAGKNDQERAALYLKFYRCIDDVDPSRAIYLDYDQLCSHPEQTLERFEKTFRSKLNQICQLHGINTPEWKFDREVFCQAHATTNQKRCIGKRTPDGDIKLESVESYNKEEWTPEREEALQPFIKEYNQIMKRRKLNLEPFLEEDMPAFPEGSESIERKSSQEFLLEEGMPAFPEGSESIERKSSQEFLLEEDMPAFPEGSDSLKRKFSQEIFLEGGMPAFPEKPKSTGGKKAKLQED